MRNERRDSWIIDETSVVDWLPQGVDDPLSLHPWMCFHDNVISDGSGTCGGSSLCPFLQQRDCVRKGV